MILLLRSERVMLDADLAVLYGVQTRVLIQAVKRNRQRFPGRLHVPADGRGGESFEITNCDLKRWSWCTPSR
jgi:hypothetical protein